MLVVVIFMGLGHSASLIRLAAALARHAFRLLTDAVASRQSQNAYPQQATGEEQSLSRNR
jgi:hypothetical protein